jgi:hypothetical protein
MASGSLFSLFLLSTFFPSITAFITPFDLFLDDYNILYQEEPDDWNPSPLLEHDDVFHQEEAGDWETLPLLDDIPASDYPFDIAFDNTLDDAFDNTLDNAFDNTLDNAFDNTLENDLYLAESHSECQWSSYPSRSRRGIITARESSGESCAPPENPSHGSHTETLQSIDLSRLMIIKDVEDYWCSHFRGWAFGSIPVCKKRGYKEFPSEDALTDPDSLNMVQPTGYITIKRGLLRWFNSSRGFSCLQTDSNPSNTI